MNLEDFIFEKVEGGYALTQYTGKENDEEYVQIPDTFLGEPVVELGEAVFSNTIYMEYIRIPSTVVKLGARCFWGCKSLADVFIPDSVTEMGRRVFDGCKSLEFLTLPQQITKIPPGFCQYCDNLGGVTLPSSVKVIGDAAFFHCYSLSYVEFTPAEGGGSLEKIEVQAFDYCQSLQEVHFPNTLKKLGDWCFGHCESLKAVTQESQESQESQEVQCGRGVFKESYHIRKAPVVLVKHLNEVAQSTVTLDYLLKFDTLSPQDQKTLLDNVKKRRPVQRFLFSTSVTSVVNLLFWEKFYPTLEETDAYLAQSIEKKCMETTAVLLDYKENHFSPEEREANQQKLEFMEMGFDIPSRGEFGKKWTYKTQQDGVCIFGYKGVGTEETIPTHFEGGRDIVRLMKWHEHHFYQLKKIVMGSGIRFIHKECFAYHHTLKEVVLPPTLEKLDEFVFYECTALEEIEIPASVTFIDSYALGGCTSLKRVVFLGKIPKMRSTALVGSDQLEFIGGVDGVNLLI